MGFAQPPGAVVTRDGAGPPCGAVAPFIRSGTPAAVGLAARAGCSGDGSLRAAEVASAAALRGLALRPVTGSEVLAIGAMWERCSLATRMARFHAPVRDIPASYLKAVLSDPAANILAVREPAGGVVALASLIRSPGSGTAELGVLVEDAWQRRGIGRRLVAYLVAAAPARGITTLTAAVLAGNAEVAGLLRQVPGQFCIAGDGEILNVRVRLGCFPEGRRPEALPARQPRLAGHAS
jgi:GNAT superfamily N-acetyltransferase